MSTASAIKSQFDTNFQAALRSYDCNRDGFVDKNELIAVLQRACIPYWNARCYVEEIFSALDKNNDGRLSAADAQTGICNNICNNTTRLVEHLKRLFREDPLAAFNTYNTDCDCWISEGDIVNVLTRDGVSCYEAGLAARQLFSELDRDHNRLLSLQELTRC